jgi:hypothetical protein
MSQKDPNVYVLVPTEDTQSLGGVSMQGVDSSNQQPTVVLNSSSDIFAAPPVQSKGWFSSCCSYAKSCCTSVGSCVIGVKEYVASSWVGSCLAGTRDYVVKPLAYATVKAAETAGNYLLTVAFLALAADRCECDLPFGLEEVGKKLVASGLAWSTLAAWEIVSALRAGTKAWNTDSDSSVPNDKKTITKISRWGGTLVSAYAATFCQENAFIKWGTFDANKGKLGESVPGGFSGVFMLKFFMTIITPQPIGWKIVGLITTTGQIIGVHGGLLAGDDISAHAKATCLVIGASGSAVDATANLRTIWTGTVFGYIPRNMKSALCCGGVNTCKKPTCTLEELDNDGHTIGKLNRMDAATDSLLANNNSSSQQASQSMTTSNIL